MTPRRRAALRALGPLRPPVPWQSPPRVLVAAHVHYPELWPELAAHLACIEVPADLVVTTTSDDPLLPATIRATHPDARILPVPNRGRDLAGLLRVLDELPGHDAVLKVHTKRSPHRRTGDAWRRAMLDDLCGDPDRVARILRVLLADPRIGMVAPERSVLGREFLGPNEARVEGLAASAGLAFDPERLWFPAGSMFWARPCVLAPLGDLGLDAHDFEAEPAPPDGTLAHALERHLGVLLSDQGLAVLETGQLPPLPTRATGW